jgi:hypothetical protein
MEVPMSVRSDRSAAGRRRFLKVVGLAGLSSAVAAPMMALAADSKPSRTRSTAKPAAAPPPAPPAAAPPEISDEGRALARVVKERYGAHLTAAQMTEIEKELTWRMRAGTALRQFKLANHDEPDFIFKA